MIFDKLENITLYKGMNPHLDTAIDFLTSHNLEELALGRTEIDGDNVFLNKMEAHAAPAETKSYEIHKKYMDLQLDLIGTEQIDTADRSGFSAADFSDEKDIGFGDGKKLVSCILGPGNFTLCMAEEPHKPGISTSEDTFLVKCVLKIRA